MHVIGTAGHVDHGKSALVERLTGIDPDRFEEEKRRGLTIDLGFAWLELPSGKEIGIVDVPGHERFIKNMLAGAGGISICLFVVAANEGWKPQSAEHLAVLDVLGIRAGVVAITKSDTVDDETLELAQTEAEERIAASSLAGAPIVPVSALTGAGMDRLIDALDRVVSATPPAPDRGRPRLWVDRVFTIAGAGTVVTGTLAGGALGVGQEVELSPEGRRARVRALQSHKKELREIGPGNRVALNLVGLDRHVAQRGDAVVAPGQWVPSARLDAAIRVLSEDLLDKKHELNEKGAHLLYAGSAETPVRIKLLDTRALAPGQSGYAQLSLRDPLPLERGDRFVLRDAGRVLTFGGGVVVDPAPAAARRGDLRRLEFLRTLERANAQEALRALVELHGSLPVDEALRRSGAEDVSNGPARLGRTLFSPQETARLEESVRKALTDHHLRNPLELGLDREILRAEVGLPEAEFADLVRLVDDVVVQGSHVRLRSHSVALDPEQQKQRDELVNAIESAGFAPPLASELQADPALLRSLMESGELVKIGDFYLTATLAQDVRTKVRTHIEESGPATVADIRDLLGTTRKYAVPLCEWLDAIGATRRRGDVRVLGPAAD